MEKTSRLDDEDGKWMEWGDDLSVWTQQGKTQLHLKKVQNFD